MAQTTVDAERFRTGRVIRRMIEAARDNAAAFGLLCFLLAVLPQAGFGVLEVTVLPKPAPGDWVAAARGAPGESFVTTFMGIMLGVALLHGAISGWRGRRLSARECFAANQVFGTVFLIRVLGAFAILFASLLLIVPGVMLALAWSMAVPVAVEERLGLVRSFGRSLVLTRHNRWSILLAVLTIGALGILALTVLLTAFAGLSLLIPAAADPLSELLIQPVSLAGLTLIGALGSASIYYELKLIKEGPGPVEAASVFA
jgi:hypothetical protein